MDPISVVAAVVGLLYVILLVVILASNRSSNSKCTGDCDQGRHCTCDDTPKK